MDSCFFYDKNTHILKSGEPTFDDAFFGFCVLRDYNEIYTDLIPKYSKSPEIYALPNTKKMVKAYNGLHRFGLLDERLTREGKKGKKRFNKYLFSSSLLESDSEANEYRSLFYSCDYRLVFTRLYSQECEIPEGYSFAGLDIVCAPSADGAFSFIRDCFFTCESYGCDKNGKEFLCDFEKLNDNGLFERYDDAFDFIKHFFSFGLMRSVNFYIYEVYLKENY